MIHKFRTPDANPRNKYSQLTTGLLEELENRRPFIFRRGREKEPLASLKLAVLEEKKRIAAVPGRICGELYHHFWDAGAARHRTGSSPYDRFARAASNSFAAYYHYYHH